MREKHDPNLQPNQLHHKQTHPQPPSIRSLPNLSFLQKNWIPDQQTGDQGPENQDQKPIGVEVVQQL